MINRTPSVLRPRNTDSIMWKMGKGRIRPCWPYIFSFPCICSLLNLPQCDVTWVFSPQLHLFFMFHDSFNINTSLPPIMSNRTPSHACPLLMHIHWIPNVHHLHRVLQAFLRLSRRTQTWQSLLRTFSASSLTWAISAYSLPSLACYEPLSIFIRFPLL